MLVKKFVTQSKRDLPDFNTPPVVEVVLGVQFTPLEAFSIQHYGLFLAKVRDEYTKFIPQPPLPAVMEGFNIGAPREISIGLEFANAPEFRGWYIDESETRLMQVQRDRFLFNWRKVKGDEVYPHYENIEPKFRSEWERFCGFCMEEKLGVPDVNQCEVTYVNHLEMGKGWKTYGELSKVIACWSGETSEAFLPEPEKVMLKAQYVMEDKRGRFYISLQPAIRRHDAKEILKIELIARGKPNSSRLEDILEWFELGHRWIVRGFTAFTSKQMHLLWERKT